MKPSLNKTYHKMKLAGEIGITLRNDWKKLELLMRGQDHGAEMLIYLQQHVRLTFLLYDVLRELCAYQDEYQLPIEPPQEREHN